MPRDRDRARRDRRSSENTAVDASCAPDARALDVENEVDERRVDATRAESARHACDVVPIAVVA